MVELPKEILKKVKLLEISTRKLVNNIFAGEYRTAFRGQGMTFADFREYVAGDDVRSISWPLTARTGKPFIKKFEEERELTLMLAVDISGSTDFGSGKYLKGEVMAYLSALLAFSAVKNRDQIGLVLFSDHIEHFVPPGKGNGQVQRILRDLLYFKPKSRKTSIASVANYLQGVLKKRSVVFLFSDFIDENFDSSLRLLGRKHDLIAVIVEDHLEKQLSGLGLIELSDAESGQSFLIDSSSPELVSNWQSLFQQEQQARDSQLRKAMVERIVVDPAQDIVQPLLQFFARRHRK